MRQTPTELATWARNEADWRAKLDVNGMSDGCDPTISKLRAIADTLDLLDKDRERLTYLDTRRDLAIDHEEGDPDVGLFPNWIAARRTKQHIEGRLVYETEGMNPSIRGLIDDVRSSEVVEPQRSTPMPPQTS